MKNNRLTNSEVSTLKDCAKEIKRLAAMENCSFRSKETIDLQSLKAWLIWFKIEANKISEILEDVENE
jgi:hypothetical protein